MDAEKILDAIRASSVETQHAIRDAAVETIAVLREGFAHERMASERAEERTIKGGEERTTPWNLIFGFGGLLAAILGPGLIMVLTAWQLASAADSSATANRLELANLKAMVRADTQLRNLQIQQFARIQSLVFSKTFPELHLPDLTYYPGQEP